MVDDLEDRGIRHVLLVTSADHLTRSMAVGQVVAGSRGIHPWRARRVHAQCSEESQFKRWRDLVRGGCVDRERSQGWRTLLQQSVDPLLQDRSCCIETARRRPLGGAIVGPTRSCSGRKRGQIWPLPGHGGCSIATEAAGRRCGRPAGPPRAAGN